MFVPVICQALCWALGTNSVEGMILASVLKISVSESVVAGGATSPLPENVLGLQILKSHLKPTEIRNYGCGIQSLPGESDAG